MKSIKELLDNIEDDMELMGENHIIYLMEQDDEVIDYDYLPSEGYSEAVTLKQLRTELMVKMRGKELIQKKKIAVVFPGIGYTCDRPLLYYSEKIARNLGYEIFHVSYGELPSNVKGDNQKKRQAVEMAMAHTMMLLNDIDWNQYEEILFISKSIGTIISTSCAETLGLEVKNILFTPVEQTFDHAVMPAVAFHGLADDWTNTTLLRQFAEEKKIPMYTYADANHSLETGDVKKDLQNLQKILEDVQHFIIKE